MDAFFEFILPIWVEVCFAVFFSLGWLLITFKGGNGETLYHKPQRLKADADSATHETTEAQLHTAVEEATAAGQTINVVKAWRKAQAAAPASAVTLRLVAKALLVVSPDTLVAEIVQHIERHAARLCNAKVAAAVLDALAGSRDPARLEEMHTALKVRLGISSTYQVYEALLGGHAAAGNETRVLEIIAELHGMQQKLTARGHALVIKGFLLQGLLDPALRQVRALLGQGFYVPPFAVTLLMRVAAEAGRAAELFEALRAEVRLTQEAVLSLLDDCVRRGDLELADSVESHVRADFGWGSEGTPFPHNAYSSLLKVNVSAAHAHAFELFEEMQASGVRVTEGLCTALLSRAAESKFLRFAEEVARFLRAREGMTVTVYSALMKVYAYCDLHGRACDLYGEIVERGLEPDDLMYGCLLRFAVEADRTELLYKLSDSAPQLDSQTCMLLIQSAGRTKDVGRAFAVLHRMASSGLTVDTSAYNCVLDACVRAGDQKRASDLVREMRGQGTLDIVTHNIRLKGACAAGDVENAWTVFAEIEKDGLKANHISYNCMINVTASVGRFGEAWDLIDAMGKAGVEVDRYTVSTMMKATKRTSNPRYIRRALALLDRTGLDASADGVLLNTTIDFCVRHGEAGRLQRLVDAWERSGQQPDVRICGALIKAYAMLQDVSQCWRVWEELTEGRGMSPNDVTLGCMLDALVTNHWVSDAVALFRKWKPSKALESDEAKYHMVLYSTLIKGFAAEGRFREAMVMWREIRAGRGRMNVVVYNALIDVQARIGAMEEVQELLAAMEPDGVTPDSITFATTVKGYCVRGSPDQAFEVFRSMQLAGLATDCVVYNTILDGCIRQGRMDLADRVLEDMERNKIKPSNFTLGILVKMFGRRRQLDKAFKVVEQLAAAHALQPNIQVKTCLISACISNGALERGRLVFEGMKASAEEPMDARAFNVMMSGYVRAGRVHEAVQLVEDAYGLHGGGRRIAAKQDISLEALQNLLRALGRRGAQERLGKPLLEKLRAAGVPLAGRLVPAAVEGAT